MKPDNQHQTYEELYAEEAAIARAQGLIEWIMEKENVSQKELAGRLNVSEASVSRLLGADPENLSVRRLARILYVLGDKLDISSEMWRQEAPNQQACGVRKISPSWEISEKNISSHLAMTFVDISVSKRNPCHNYIEDSYEQDFETVTFSKSWPRHMKEIVASKYSSRQAELEDA